MTLYEWRPARCPSGATALPIPRTCRPSTEITIKPEVFDSGLREGLTAFFQKAFRRDVTERFDNAEEMLTAWRDCFKDIEESGADFRPGRRIQAPRAAGRRNLRHLDRRVGAGHAGHQRPGSGQHPHRRGPAHYHAAAAVTAAGRRQRNPAGDFCGRKILRERLGTPSRETSTTDQPDPPPEMLDLAALGVDLLADRLQSIGSRESETVHRTLQVLLIFRRPADPAGWREAGVTVGEGNLWPSQTDVARPLEVTRARVGQILGKLQDRWARDPAITQLRADMVDIVAGQGGVMTVPEMVEAVLACPRIVAGSPPRARSSPAPWSVPPWKWNAR